MSPIVAILLMLLAGALGAAAGFMYRKQVTEQKIGRAEQYANDLLNEATRKAEDQKKERILEAKEEVLRLKQDLDREIHDRRAEQQRGERRVAQREETLDKKLDNLEKREERLNRKSEEIQAALDEAERLKNLQSTELERIAGMTADEAAQVIISRVQKEAYHDAAASVREIEQKAKEEGDKKARNIISLAIQKCASDHVAETTVSVIALPNDDMKGRIIGREGRNIRALETATGVDLIIDDTPEAIIISAFDPVRREVARIALEKLLQDGRIHPARIEEMYHKAADLVQQRVREAGEQAAFDTGIHDLHPEIVKTLGALRYRTSFGQNVLQHSLEVSDLCGVMASELGLDVVTAKRAGLLHDLGKAIDHDVEGPHAVIGAELARRYGEKPVIVHAIEAHHADVDPNTVLDVLVQAADAVSASRPGARRESAENYIKRLEKLEEIANSHDGVERTYAMQAGREVHVMVQPDKISDAQSTVLAHDIAHQIEEEMEYPGQVRVVVIRESRAVDIAK